jgi:hypothetical protein
MSTPQENLSMTPGDEEIISNGLRELFKVLTESAEKEEKEKIKTDLEDILRRV